MRRTIVFLAALVALPVSACSDDSEPSELVGGGTLGSACACDSDCKPFGNWSPMCVKGICMVAPEGDCSAATPCPDGTTCISFQHEGENIAACSAACTNQDLECQGECDPQTGACVPRTDDNCLLGCCTIADPPLPGPEGPDYPDRDWDQPICGGDDYPCPPYGKRVGRVMANEVFLAGNRAADRLGHGEGLVDMRDLYKANHKLIIIMAGAGW